MTSVSTGLALDNVPFLAISRLVTDLVALEAEFGIAHERIMRGYAAQDASHLFALVWALTSHMPELFAPITLNRWVRSQVVPRCLALQFTKHVVNDSVGFIFI